MKSKTYDEFVEKFKPKLTTDDCYTPPVVYEAVANWTANEYGLDKSAFVRPFYSGGDYENFDYSGKIVVDNPPFSILSKIVDFYVNHGIRFLLFAPTLVSVIRLSDVCSVLCTGVDITYENGAVDYNAAGYNSSEEKLTMLTRLLPFVEKRLNLIELAPKGTGKSYLFGRVSRYGWLSSGGVMSRAKMFYDISKRTEGLVSGNDFITLDEVQTISFTDVDEMRAALKGYLEF